MPVISDRHALVKFVAGETKPFEDQRLVKIGYKKTKDNPNPLESVAVSVNKLALTNEDAIALLPYLKSFVEDVQDRIIRYRYEEGATEISDKEINIKAVIKYLSEASSISGGRLTKAAILEWCENSGYSDALRLRFAELLNIGDTPTDEEAKQVELQVAGYTEKLASLTGPKTYYEPEVARKLLQSLKISKVSDSIVDKFEVRLKEMINKPKSLGINMLSL